MCFDAKEFKSVKVNGVKVQKQKKLLLLNIKELFQEFQKKYPLIKIGLSKTFDLRSKWVVVVVGRARSTVNVKSMRSVLPVKPE